MNPALTTGARKPNHWGLEKWNRTMLMAAKQRNPVSAFSGAGLTSVLAARLHVLLDVSERQGTGNRKTRPIADLRLVLWQIGLDVFLFRKAQVAASVRLSQL